MTAEDNPAAFMASVEALLQRPDPQLSGLQAGILAALYHGIAQDSRSFARRLGLAHALALRATTETEALGLLAVVRRDARTQRSTWCLTDTGAALVASAAEARPPNWAKTAPVQALRASAQPFHPLDSP